MAISKKTAKKVVKKTTTKKPAAKKASKPKAKSKPTTARPAQKVIIISRRSDDFILSVFVMDKKLLDKEMKKRPDGTSIAESMYGTALDIAKELNLRIENFDVDPASSLGDVAGFLLDLRKKSIPPEPPELGEIAEPGSPIDDDDEEDLDEDITDPDYDLFVPDAPGDDDEDDIDEEESDEDE